MKRRYILPALLLLLALWYFLAPRNAVSGEYRVREAEQNGVYITDRLDEATLVQLEALLSQAKCRRWSNPLGSHPQENSVCILGTDASGPVFFCLAGSIDRYTAEDHELIHGKELLEQIQELLENT